MTQFPDPGRHRTAHDQCHTVTFSTITGTVSAKTDDKWPVAGRIEDTAVVAVPVLAADGRGSGCLTAMSLPSRGCSVMGWLHTPLRLVPCRLLATQIGLFDGWIIRGDAVFQMTIRPVLYGPRVCLAATSVSKKARRRVSNQAGNEAEPLPSRPRVRSLPTRGPGSPARMLLTLL